MEHGADLNAHNHSGDTPLHNPWVPVEKFDILIEHGANKEAQNAVGETPIVVAVRAGAVEHVEKYDK